MSIDNATDIGAVLSNRVKQRLTNGEIPLGTIISSSRNPETVRMIAAAGFDFVWIDLQHSAIGLEQVADMCLLARASGITPIVRPDVLTFEQVHRILDIGAMGIVFYDVRTPEQLTEYESWIRTPIETPNARDFTSGDKARTDRLVTEAILFVAQIESREAVEGLDSLIAVTQPDILQIGRNDLADSLGVRHELYHPTVMAAIDKIIESAAPRSITVAAGYYGTEDARDLMARGVRCFHHGSDASLLMEAYRNGVGTLQGLAQELVI